MRLFTLIIAVAFSAIGCSSSDGNPPLDDSSEPVAVWTSSSVKADLYLLPLNELRDDWLELPTPIGSILRSTATPEQLTELQSLVVDRPFERTGILCDTQAGHDTFYLIITDQSDTIRRFPQYDECAFSLSQGEGFFQEQADGFLEVQQICDFGMSFGVEGFACSER